MNDSMTKACPITLRRSRLPAVTSLFVALLLTACAGTETLAPVESRSTSAPVAPRGAEPAQASAVTPAPLPRPGYHVVKRGETLYSIALENGQDYREVARWNGLDNPNVIQVGQELRIAPPDTGMSVAPVTLPSIEVKPVAGQTPPAAASGGAAITPTPASPTQLSLKTTPKGGRVAYSPQALAELQKAPATPTPATPQAPTPPVAPVMTSSPAVPTAVSAPAAASAQDGKGGDEAVDWLWPTGGKLVATFNDNSSKGIDLAGNVGDPVLATAAGKVIYVGSDLRGYGNLVIIKHNSLYLSAYAHNSEVLVKEGAQVARGQKIAAVGMSDADRPKLHFEIRRQGKPVDPLKFLPKR